MKPVAVSGLLLGILVLTGCALNSATVGSLEPDTGEQVRAEVSVFNALGLNPTSVEEIDAALERLSEQCGGGPVTGVVTLFSTTYAVIGVIEKTEVMGRCAEP